MSDQVNEIAASKQLYWHCECGNHEPAQPEYRLGDFEPCVNCDDGTAHVVTLGEAVAWEHAIATDPIVGAAQAAVNAIDALIEERPQMAMKVTGHTTLGNIRAELKGAVSSQLRRVANLAREGTQK